MKNSVDSEKSKSVWRKKKGRDRRKKSSATGSQLQQASTKPLYRAREAKRLALAHEPREDDKESVKLTIRLPDGQRVSRRFHMLDTVQTVLDYIDVSQGLPADNYVLVSNFPKYVEKGPFFSVRSLTMCRQAYSQVKQTLKDAQIYPHPVALFVQEK